MEGPKQWFQFRLEQFIVRGPFRRLLIMAAFVAAIAFTAGIVVFASGEFKDPLEASWWAFLRLTDPGYLGDDEGIFKRIVSTVVTVMGYVVFMGALIAIMTQWFQATVDRIESGKSPVSMQDHFVVLGWTNRTAAIVRELLVSEGRVRRFYQKLGSHKGLQVVILSDEPVAKVREDLRSMLGRRYDPDQIVVRVGNVFRASHLKRVDFLHAAAVLLPADPTGVEHPTNLDAITIKSLLSAVQASRELGITDRDQLPLLVAELTDERKVNIADEAYGGPIETLATDRIVGRLIAQAVRHRGVSGVYKDFLAHSWGNEIYARHWHGTDCTFREVVGSYRDAIAFGSARGPDGALDITLNPPLDQVVEKGDRIVLLAPNISATEAVADSGAFKETKQNKKSPGKRMPPKRRILVLGWSRKVPVLLGEFEAYENEHFEVSVVSLIGADEREREVDRRIGDLIRTQVTHIEADFTSESDLDDLAIDSYDTLVFVSSDWLEGDELADARTLLGYMVVQTVLVQCDDPPPLVVELRSGDSHDLLGKTSADVVVSPEMVSHMMCHIALRRELGEVFEELFGPHGAEIFFVGAHSYGIDPGLYSFEDLRRHVAAYGDCALGVRLGGAVRMNPPASESLEFGEDDEIVILTRGTTRSATAA